MKIFGFYPWPFRPKGYCCCLHPSVCLSVSPSVYKLYLVRMITRHRFELESPNLNQTCIMAYSQLVFKMEVIDLDLQGHFGHFDLLWIWARITKFAPNVHLGILSAGIENGGLIFKVIWSFHPKKQLSASLLYSDLGRPRGITHPHVLLLVIVWTNGSSVHWTFVSELISIS